VARANYQFAELPIVEIRNRLLEQFRVLERLNTSLLLDGRILFCLPFLVGVHPEPVFGELRRGEDEEEADSGVPTSSIRPDIRFEVDFRKLGHVLGVIFMRRKRISLFFENKDARNFCSGQLRLLSDLLGEEWMIEIDLKARYLNKKITA
jgi:hypothetical protein